ncbi:hypothetical protein [Chryseobacterium mucoviscidosis]|uniref:Sugar-binding protein n=1 Tax=Chryseobacterium mucoviscidosis TaxID=1945581 RepID=A0A202C6S2_9FLAO|nr:hypothetical protein [Chryseobacterium mucoviscidosis]OVE59398.1 hypothetical protein B0E34_05630 [Chryseobacterium mucoviscidosis]
MKKIFLLALYLLSCSLYLGQQESQNIGVTQPTPTAASLTAYKNIPVSIQTGVPNISYPLINLSTNSKKVEINLGLNYHTANVSEDKWASNVGKGWSLLGTGVISREIIDDFDESFDDATFHKYQKNYFDDIYNFSIPGETGKFRIIRDTINNTFQITKLSNYTAKVEYIRNSNTATLIIDSFIVTSDTGIKYKFENYDLDIMTVWRWNHPLTGPKYSEGKYRSAFYLTSIYDENDNELARYTYIKDLKYPPGVDQVTETETNKLVSIEVKDQGIIEINTSKEDVANTKNDNFRINDIILKTFDNRFIKKYHFNYSYTLPLTRNLDSFQQVDINGDIIEKYSFYYTGIQNGFESEDEISATVLRRIQLPTGGIIEYDFDLIPYSFITEYIQHPAPTTPYGSISFSNINSNTKKYFFTVNTTSDITIDANIANLSDHTWALQFYRKVGSSFQLSPYSIGTPVDPDPGYPLQQIRTFEPGEYYVELFTNDMFVNLSSDVTFEAAIRTGDPFTTNVLKMAKGLPRIKKIKSLNVDYNNTYNAMPSGIEEYEYSMFDNPATSSGEIIEGGSKDGLIMYNPVIIYKNVKVSNGNNNGYTKYYFKAPSNYPFNQGFWPNYNLTREGLINKKEIYNSLNQKLSEDLFDYTFEEFGPQYLVAPSNVSANFLIKTTWLKNEKVTSKSFFDSGVLETQREIIRNTNNFKTSLERSTSFDGSIQETSYQYPFDKNNQKLLNANITGIPLETTLVVKKNSSDVSKLISRSETKFDNVSHFFPTSTVSYDSQNNISSEAVFNQYDAKGNLEQYTTKDGIPVSVVWGYNKTLPIAKIEGATYSQISSYTSDIITKSNADVDVSSEKLLQDALDIFRNNAAFSSYQITTYVYDPLIGMKSSTPPSGIREIYKYDKANRLEQIIDENGKVLKKYQYNYKQ